MWPGRQPLTSRWRCCRPGSRGREERFEIPRQAQHTLTSVTPVVSSFCLLRGAAARSFARPASQRCPPAPPADPSGSSLPPCRPCRFRATPGSAISASLTSSSWLLVTCSFFTSKQTMHTFGTNQVPSSWAWWPCPPPQPVAQSWGAPPRRHLARRAHTSAGTTLSPWVSLPGCVFGSCL